MAAARATAAEKQGRPEGLGVTIKTGKGYEDTWLNFTGTPDEVRANIKAVFELDDEGLTLFELVQNATKTAHGVTTAVKGLGGTTVPSATSAPTSDEAQQPSGSDPFAEVEKEREEPVNPYTSLLQQVEAQTSVPDLQKFYAQNKALFTAGTDEAEAATKAWQAKGRALKKKA